MSLSDIIAIIAMVVSVSSLGVQFYVEWKRNRKDRIRDLYNQAYKELLMEDIPAAVLALSWTKDGIKGTGDFAEVCRKLRHHSGFFKFYDEIFYQKVVLEIMKIEDFVLEFDNHLYKKDKFSGKIVKLNAMLKDLYELIMDRCL